MRIVIWVPPQGFDEACGGIVVLYKLCHMLRERGTDAYLYGNHTMSAYKDWSTPTTNTVKDSIVVYPEIVNGNPLQTDRVVRWLLNKPGVIGGDEEYGKDDLIFHYADKFRSAYPSSQLMIFERWANLFNQIPEYGRNGGCYLNHKGTSKKRNSFTQFAVEIKCGNLKALVDIFRQSEYFYSYDSTTFLSVAAALCGCLSIVAPDDGVSATEWRTSHLMNRYGIAYGIEDIPYALETQSLVLPHMEYLERESERQLDQFLIKLRQHFEPHEKYVPKVLNKVIEDITVVIQSCSLDLKSFEEFVSSYQKIVGSRLPRPVVCIDLTKWEPVPVPYLEMIINGLKDNGIFYHQRTHKEDYESCQDAGWFTLARGVERAKRDRTKAILFLEDDIQFSSQFISALTRIDYHRKEFGLCTFYQPYGGFPKITKEVIHSGYCFGTQCMVFSVEAAEYLVNNRESISKRFPPGKDLRWLNGLEESPFSVECLDKSYVQHINRYSRMGNMKHRSDVFVP